MQPKKQSKGEEPQISSEDRELVELLKQEGPNFVKKLKDAEIVSLTRIVSKVHYSGPLPPPDLLRQFNEIIPNGAERIVTQFEEQSSHRREIEKTVIISQQKRSNAGQWLAFALALISISSSVFLALTNHEWVASVLGGTTVVGLCSIFVIGKNFQSRNLRKKNNED